MLRVPNPRPRKPMRLLVRSNRSPMYAPLFWSSNSARSAPLTIDEESLRNLNITWLSSSTTPVGSLGNRIASSTAYWVGLVFGSAGR
jgi:hypothetical protein